jgi:hypothetical protein
MKQTPKKLEHVLNMLWRLVHGHIPGLLIVSGLGLALISAFISVLFSSHGQQPGQPGFALGPLSEKVFGKP